MQEVELKASKILWLGKCDNGKGKYPLSKKGQSMESLRERLHLRPRTNLIGAVARIRNALAHATHTFFQSRGFIYVHTPLITTSDCEGAGEMFQVILLWLHLQENMRLACNLCHCPLVGCMINKSNACNSHNGHPALHNICVTTLRITQIVLSKSRTALSDAPGVKLE